MNNTPKEVFILNFKRAALIPLVVAFLIVIFGRTDNVDLGQEIMRALLVVIACFVIYSAICYFMAKHGILVDFAKLKNLKTSGGFKKLEFKIKKPEFKKLVKKPVAKKTVEAAKKPVVKKTVVVKKPVKVEKPVKQVKKPLFKMPSFTAKKPVKQQVSVPKYSCLQPVESEFTTEDISDYMVMYPNVISQESKEVVPEVKVEEVKEDIETVVKTEEVKTEEVKTEIKEEVKGDVVVEVKPEVKPDVVSEKIIGVVEELAGDEDLFDEVSNTEIVRTPSPRKAPLPVSNDKIPQPKTKPQRKPQQSVVSRFFGGSSKKKDVDLVKKAQIGLDAIKRNMPKFNESRKPSFDVGSTKLDFDSDDLKKSAKIADRKQKEEHSTSIDSCRLLDIAKHPEIMTNHELKLIKTVPEVRQRYDAFLKNMSDNFDKNKDLYYLKRL